MYALSNFRYFQGQQLIADDCFIIKDEKIDAIIPAGQLPGDLETIDLQGNYLAHGFIDLQINGGTTSFFPYELTEESLNQIYEDHLQLGTTHFLATMITSSLDEMLRAIEAVRACMRSGNPGLLGLHLEGPFINAAKKGAHNESYIRNPTREELEIILKAGEGVVKMMTIAPELFDKELLDLLRSGNMVLSAGHSDATVERAMHSFENGVSTVTHLYNAMSQFNSRNPGLVGAALNSDVYSAIIADGLHCDDTAIAIAWKLKQDKLFLVSDATLIGKEDTLLNGKKYLYRNGSYVNEEGNLAGSNIAMLHGVINCVQRLKIPVSQVFEMASSIPAKVLGCSDSLGSIGVKREANLVILSDDWRVNGVLVKGQYRKLSSM